MFVDSLIEGSLITPSASVDAERSLACRVHVALCLLSSGISRDALHSQHHDTHLFYMLAATVAFSLSLTLSSYAAIFPLLQLALPLVLLLIVVFLSPSTFSILFHIQ